MNQIIITPATISDFLKAGNADFIGANVILSNWSESALRHYKEQLQALLYYSSEVVIRNCESTAEGLIRGILTNVLVVAETIEKIVKKVEKAASKAFRSVVNSWNTLVSDAGYIECLGFSYVRNNTIVLSNFYRSQNKKGGVGFTFLHYTKVT
ncbi:MAG: hypothetical protein KME43_19285 [Myxacorys chilensis ATA2-1-KO14]|jgi:hypothetical protein|nr:hypothetical protein [Myxacorys chilensis ATA2-1-KO14]